MFEPSYSQGGRPASLNQQPLLADQPSDTISSPFAGSIPSTSAAGISHAPSSLPEVTHARHQLSCWQLAFSCLSAAGSSLMRMAQVYIAFKIFQGEDLAQAPLGTALPTLGALSVLPMVNRLPICYKETHAFLATPVKLKEFLYKEMVERPLSTIATTTAMVAEAFIVSNSVKELFSAVGEGSVIPLSIVFGTACAIQLLFAEGRSFKQLLNEGLAYTAVGELHGCTKEQRGAHRYDSYLKQFGRMKWPMIVAIHVIPVLDALGATALAFVESRELVISFMGYSDDEQLNAQVSGTVASMLAPIYGALHYALYGHHYKKVLARWLSRHTLLSDEVDPAQITRGSAKPIRADSCANRYPHTAKLLYFPILLSALVHGGVFMAAGGQMYQIFTSGGSSDSPVSVKVILSMLVLGIPAIIQSAGIEGRGLQQLAQGSLLDEEVMPALQPSHYRIKHLLSDAVRVMPLIVFRWLMQSAFFNDLVEINDYNRLYIYFLSSGGTVFSWVACVEVPRLMRTRPEIEHFEAEVVAVDDEKSRVPPEQSGPGKHPHGRAGLGLDEEEQPTAAAVSPSPLSTASTLATLPVVRTMTNQERYKIHVHHENEYEFYHSWPRLISQGLLQAALGTLLGAYTEILVQKTLKADNLSSRVALVDALVVGAIISGWLSVFASRLLDYGLRVRYKVDGPVELFTKESVEALLEQELASSDAVTLSLPENSRDTREITKFLQEFASVIASMENRKAIPVYDPTADEWALLHLEKQPPVPPQRDEILTARFYSPTNNYSFWNKTKKAIAREPQGQPIHWRRQEIFHPITKLDSAPWVLAQMQSLQKHGKIAAQPKLGQQRKANTEKVLKNRQPQVLQQGALHAR